MSIGERIADLRRNLDLSQKELAQRIGISQQAIDKIEQGHTKKPRKILELAQILGTSTEFLVTGEFFNTGLNKGFEARNDFHRQNNHSRIERPISTEQTKKDLPVLGRAQGGPEGNLTFGGEAIDWTYRPADLSGVRESFAVYVTGSSMLPKYQDGDLAYVHPNKPIRKGRYVLLETVDHVGFIKKFIKWDGDTLILEQYNPQKTLRFPRKDILRLMLIIGSMDG